MNPIQISLSISFWIRHFFVLNSCLFFACSEDANGSDSSLFTFPQTWHLLGTLLMWSCGAFGSKKGFFKTLFLSGHPIIHYQKWENNEKKQNNHIIFSLFMPIFLFFDAFLIFSFFLKFNNWFAEIKWIIKKQKYWHE